LDNYTPFESNSGFFLNAFHGGSHGYFASELIERSNQNIELLKLPARNWKWRMHGSAISFAKQLSNSLNPSFIIATDLLDLAVLKGLLKTNSQVPTALYMHENQITYPWNSSDPDLKLKRNHHYGFINYTSLLAADKVVFNSHYHLNELLHALPNFLGMFPDHKELDLIESIRSKSQVIYPGLATDLGQLTEKTSRNTKRIVWNHRWEYDKNPDAFFNVLHRLKQEQIPFELIVLGEKTNSYPKCFDQAKEEFKTEIIHWGYCSSHTEYQKWLLEGDVLPVTSNQDFFGLSATEGMACGLYPLLPNRLAFPEHLPHALHQQHLYDSDEELFEKLKLVLTKENHTDQHIRDYVLEKYSWEKTTLQFDELIDSLINY
jgi:glycosyltransferase involved in cell wall biosynthesis